MDKEKEYFLFLQDDLMFLPFGEWFRTLRQKMFFINH